MPRIKITTARLIGAAFVAAVTSAAIVGSTGTANAIANLGGGMRAWHAAGKPMAAAAGAEPQVP